MNYSSHSNKEKFLSTPIKIQFRVLPSSSPSSPSSTSSPVGLAEGDLLRIVQIFPGGTCIAERYVPTHSDSLDSNVFDLLDLSIFN